MTVGVNGDNTLIIFFQIVSTRHVYYVKFVVYKYIIKVVVEDVG